MDDSRILELGIRIGRNTAKVNEYLAANNLPQPSFDLNAPSQFPIPDNETEIAAARKAVLHDCLELRALMFGPREYLESFQHNELVSQQIIARFKLAEAVPIGGEVTFAELADISGLHEIHLRKLLRLAVSIRKCGVGILYLCSNILRCPKMNTFSKLLGMLYGILRQALREEC